MKNVFALVILFALSLNLIAGTQSTNVVYGEDNREDVFESKNSIFVELAKSTAAMIKASTLSSRKGEVEITGKTLASRGVCLKERFSKQITAASCSGFLVAENILVTAGHCIKTEDDCKSYKWVFDYKVDHADQGTIKVSEEQVYGCSRIIERSLDSVSKNDFAVIELNRKVLDRSPLKFRRTGRINVGDSVLVIGHPTGLPTKIAAGANVRKLSGKYFVSNLDTFAGNSGSAVFNASTSELEGILVRGENDYVQDSSLGCQVVNRCTDAGCRGEDVTYITNIGSLKKIP